MSGRRTRGGGGSDAGTGPPARTRTRPGWLRLVGHGVRWRWRASMVLVLVGAVAVGAGAAAPMALRASETSSLIAAGEGNAAAASPLVVGQGGSAGAAAFDRAVSASPAGRTGRWFAPPSLEEVAGVLVPLASGTYGADLVAHNNLCAHLTLAAGRCPTRAGQVAVSTRSAAAVGGLALGDRLRLPGTGPVTIVGHYRTPPASSPFWIGGNVFVNGSIVQRSQAPLRLVYLDALLATRASVLAASSPGSPAQLAASVPLRASQWGSATASALLAGLERWQTRLVDVDHLAVSGSLAGVLRGVLAGDGEARTVVGIAAAQLVALGLIIVYLLVSIAAAERREEAAMAARRGFTRRQLLAVSAGEPLLALLVALPVGLLASWALLGAAGRSLFTAGTPVGPSGSAVGVAVAVAAAGAVAALAASWDLTRGAARSGRREGRARATRIALDAAAIALAVAGASALTAGGSLSGGRANPVAVAAPAMLALGGGVLGLRIAEALVGLGVRATGNRGPITLFLALRSVLRRRPAPLRRVLALTAAVVVCVFGVEAWAAAAADRAAVAAVTTGAPEVADVHVPAGVDLASAVDRADPGGRTAMAAELVRSPQGTTLAVQADRLARVAAWPGGLADATVSTIARRLQPRERAPITFRGAHLTATISEPAGQPVLSLTATVFDEASQEQTTFSFPRIHPGTATYTAPTVGSCPTTCRLVELTPSLVNPNATTPASVSFTLAGLSSGGRSLEVGAAGGWTAQPGGVTVTTAGSGVRFSVPSADIASEGVLLGPADVPAALPAVTTAAVLAAGSTSPGGRAIPGVGLDGGVVNLRVVDLATTLPGVGADAALISLGDAELVQTTAGVAQPEVWLTGTHRAAVLARLAHQGVTVTSARQVASTRAHLDRSALADADLVLLAAGIAAGALAAGATLYALLAGGRARREDLADLLAAGLRPTLLRRALRAETAVVLAAGLLVGAALGSWSAAVALGSLPLVPGGAAGVPLPGGLPGVPLAATLASATAVLVAVGAVAAPRVRSARRANRRRRYPHRRATPTGPEAPA